MSKSALQTNVDRWFPWKRYVLMLVCTKKCSLTYHQRLVYSYLVYRLRKDQSATKAKVAKALRLDKGTVVNALTELTNVGLAAEEQEQYSAVEPNAAQKEWFASNRRTDVPWHRQLATYVVLRPKKSSGLSTKTNALLWLLYSLAPKYGTPVVLDQYLAGLAVMLKMSERGVKQGITRLENMGLVERFGTTFVLKQPTPEALALWEDRPIQHDTAFKPLQLRLPEDTTNPDYEGTRDNVVTINERLDHFSRMMWKAGCPEQEIREFWTYVITNTLSLTQLWEYAVCDFEGTFKVCAEQHRRNGYRGHPMKLLWMKTKERFPERAANAF
jgi:DNA-binding MarR family transcriptional regulator